MPFDAHPPDALDMYLIIRAKCAVCVAHLYSVAICLQTTFANAITGLLKILDASFQFSVSLAFNFFIKQFVKPLFTLAADSADGVSS